MHTYINEIKYQKKIFNLLNTIETAEVMRGKHCNGPASCGDRRKNNNGEGESKKQETRNSDQARVNDAYLSWVLQPSLCSSS